MKNFDCLVSIIIPMYNAENYIEDAIKSILSQSYHIFEIIVVDDGSTDRSLALVLKLRDQDDRIQICRNDHKKGAAGSRNTGIQKAKGEWIAFLDADDLYLPNSLENRLKTLDIYPEAEFISADFFYLYADRSISNDSFYKTRKPEMMPYFFLFAYQHKKIEKLTKPVKFFLHTVLVVTDTVLIKRSLLNKTGLFNEDLERCEDDNLWIRIASFADLYFVPEAVALYRQHPDSITHRDEAPGNWGIKSFKLLLLDSSFEQYKSLINARISRFYADNAYYYRKNNSYIKSIVCSWLWISNDFFRLTAWKCLIASIIRR